MLVFILKRKGKKVKVMIVLLPKGIETMWIKGVNLFGESNIKIRWSSCGCPKDKYIHQLTTKKRVSKVTLKTLKEILMGHSPIKMNFNRLVVNFKINSMVKALGWS